MTTATRSVAVVATRLPTTDRRALSQAWYSALHVTQTQALVGTSKTLPAQPARVSGTHVTRETRTKFDGTPFRPAGGPQGRTALTPPFAERRGPATELAARIERALVQRVMRARMQPVTLAISAGDGRVQLLVRNDGATTRVVALCAPHLRERVDRALAQACFALAASGTRVEVA